jgi:hypothetical protein
MNMTYKKYLVLLTITTLLLLTVVASVSYIIDPARIYHDDDKLNGNSANSFASRLIKSSNGLIYPNNSWNERDIKASLAKDSSISIECAIVGSSHLFQISSFRGNKSLTNICPSLTNFAVPGGTFEDLFALSYLLMSRKNKPETIVFGITPWMLDFNKDLRWQKYRESYYSMKSIIGNDTSLENNTTGGFKSMINLLNPQYFSQSLQEIGKDKLHIKEVSEFNYVEGLVTPVLLPDGSLIYSREIISRKVKIAIGGTNYKIDIGHQYSDKAISMFKKLVTRLQEIDVKVVFLLTPYHPNIWKDESSDTAKVLLDVEPLIRGIGKELNVKVLGSYNPNKIGCDSSEFYDQMHSKDTCVGKIKN